jgi:predicted DNA-binding transcriptional regulator AlpA
MIDRMLRGPEVEEAIGPSRATLCTMIECGVFRGRRGAASGQ